MSFTEMVERQEAKRLEQQKATAERYGYTVQRNGKELAWFYIKRRGQVLALVHTEADAIRIAYALAMTFAFPDALGEALNSRDGTYRP